MAGLFFMKNLSSLRFMSLRDGLTEKEWATLQTPLGVVRGNSAATAEILRLHDKRVAGIRAENKKFKPAPFKPVLGGVISDDLGLHGVVNHADGKRYDSKSEFRKATRRAGCYEVGTDIKPRDVDWKTPTERGVRGDFDVKPALKDALHKHGVK